MTDLTDKDWNECRMHVSSKLREIDGLRAMVATLEQRVSAAEFTLFKIMAYGSLGGAIGMLAIQGFIRLGAS